MIKKGHTIQGSNALILGITFKENCPDIRNSRVIDIYRELRQFGLQVDVYDPYANKEDVLREFKLKLTHCIQGNKYDSIILAVCHEAFTEINFQDLRKSSNAVIFDTKGALDREIIDARL